MNGGKKFTNKNKRQNNLYSGYSNGSNNTLIPGSTMSTTEFMNSGYPGQTQPNVLTNENTNPPMGHAPDQNILWSSFNSRPSTVYTNWQILLRYYTSDAFFKKLIDLPIDDAMKDIKIKADDGLDDFQHRELLYLIKRKGLWTPSKQGAKASQLFGGGAFLFLNEDLEKNKEPLQAKEEGVVYLSADSWQLNKSGDNWMDDSTSFVFKEIRRYKNIDIHPSRGVIVKNSIPFNYFASVNQGWGISAYDACGKYLNMFDRYWNTVFSLLKSINIDVISVADLETAIGSEDAMIRIMQSLKRMNLAKSSYGTMIKNKDDDFGRMGIDIAGAVSIADQLANVLCAAFGIPKRYVFGEDPKGIHNGGGASMEIYGSKIQSIREDLTPYIIEILEKFCLVELGHIPTRLDIDFGNTRQPTFEQELAKQTAQFTTMREMKEAGEITEEEYYKGINEIQLLPVQIEPKINTDDLYDEE